MHLNGQVDLLAALAQPQQPMSPEGNSSYLLKSHR